MYWNRTRRNFSLRRGGIVIDRRSSLALADCVLHVGESARIRCLLQGQRDVHSWIEGNLIHVQRPPGAVRIGYRLSEPGFRRRDTGAILPVADLVFFEPDGSCWACI